MNDSIPFISVVVRLELMSSFSSLTVEYQSFQQLRAHSQYSLLPFFFVFEIAFLVQYQFSEGKRKKANLLET